MYKIKQVINKMKKVANINSNVELANTLGVSYNTLNTWLKRGKLPQETIFEFINKYKASLDYLLLDNLSNTTLFSYKTNDYNDNQTYSNNIAKYDYYGNFSELSINTSAVIHINKEKKHNNGYYLIEHNNIKYIAKVQFSIASEYITLLIDNNTHIVSTEEFNLINYGLITKIEPSE